MNKLRFIMGNVLLLILVLAPKAEANCNVNGKVIAENHAVTIFHPELFEKTAKHYAENSGVSLDHAYELALDDEWSYVTLVCTATYTSDEHVERDGFALIAEYEDAEFLAVSL